MEKLPQQPIHKLLPPGVHKHKQLAGFLTAMTVLVMVGGVIFSQFLSSKEISDGVKASPIDPKCQACTDAANIAGNAAWAACTLREEKQGQGALYDIETCGSDQACLNDYYAHKPADRPMIDIACQKHQEADKAWLNSFDTCKASLPQGTICNNPNDNSRSGGTDAECRREADPIGIEAWNKCVVQGGFAQLDCTDKNLSGTEFDTCVQQELSTFSDDKKSSICAAHHVAEDAWTKAYNDCLQHGPSNPKGSSPPTNTPGAGGGAPPKKYADVEAYAKAVCKTTTTTGANPLRYENKCYLCARHDDSLVLEIACPTDKCSSEYGRCDNYNFCSAASGVAVAGKKCSITGDVCCAYPAASAQSANKYLACVQEKTLLYLKNKKSQEEAQSQAEVDCKSFLPPNINGPLGVGYFIPGEKRPGTDPSDTTPIIVVSVSSEVQNLINRLGSNYRIDINYRDKDKSVGQNITIIQPRTPPYSITWAPVNGFNYNIYAELVDTVQQKTIARSNDFIISNPNRTVTIALTNIL